MNDFEVLIRSERVRGKHPSLHMIRGDEVSYDSDEPRIVLDVTYTGSDGQRLGGSGGPRIPLAEARVILAALELAIRQAERKGSKAPGHQGSE